MLSLNPRKQEISTEGDQLERADSAYFNRLYADNDPEVDIERFLEPYRAELLRQIDLYGAANAERIKPRTMSLAEAQAAKTQARQAILDSYSARTITRRHYVDEDGVATDLWKPVPPESTRHHLNLIYDYLEADWNLRAALVAAGQPLPPDKGFSLCSYPCTGVEEARARLRVLREKPIGFDDDAVTRLQASLKKLEDAAPYERPRGALGRFREVTANYVGCTDPVCFIRRSDKSVMVRAAFDMVYNPACNEAVQHMRDMARYRDNATKLAMSLPELYRVGGLCYRPGNHAEIMGGKFNMWIDPQVEALDEEPTIFLEHMAYLIPNDEERRLLIQWLAWCIRHPDKKIMFAILIVGREGTGKSWLGLLLEKILGRSNVVLVQSEDAATSTFNGFSENKRVAVINEIQPKSGTRVNLVERVKGLITEETLRINRKYVEAYDAENRTNLIAISNEKVPLLMHNRRWLVIRAADDPFAADDAGNQTHESVAYYDRLFGSLKGDEPGRVLGYLRRVDLTGFDGRGMAPITSAKEEIAMGDDTTPKGKIAIAYKDRSGAFAFDLFTAKGVARSILNCKEADRGTSTWMEEAGCRMIRPRKGGKFYVPVCDGEPGERAQIWAINNRVAAMYVDSTPKAIAEAYAQERAAARAEPVEADEPWPFDDDAAPAPVAADADTDDLFK